MGGEQQRDQDLWHGLSERQGDLYLAATNRLSWESKQKNKSKEKSTAPGKMADAALK